MRQWSPFFGEIVSKNDLDFLNQGMREDIVQTHNTLTNNLGGIVNGLQVSYSPDKLSLIVNPGVFYTAGSYNIQNNFGGGERGELLEQYFVRNLPATPPIGSAPQYLLVYAKVITSNVDPNAFASNQVVTSRNLQTGENVPVREYPQVSIVVTNPGFRNSLLSIEGVPLALIQVDYVGINQISSNGSIQSVDSSVRQNYTIGKSIDIVSGQLIDNAFPNNIITSRMFLDNSISGTKFSDGAVISSKLASWDGTTAYNAISGNGVANQHLKAQVVTQDKINYVSGVSDLGIRNYVFNASFEIFSGSSNLPANWDVSTTGTTSATLLTFTSDATAPKFGNTALQMIGAFDGSNNALGVSVSQIVDMGENLLNKPISAFFWARQFSATDFTKSGSTGLRGSIEFLDDTAATTIQGPIYFGVVSGVTTTDYLQYTTTAPVIYTGTQACSKIKITIGGKFSGGYYVDGIMLTESSLIPRFDVNPSEYIASGVDLIDFAQLSGKISESQIPNSIITSSMIKSGAIGNSQLGPLSVSTSNLQNGSITSAKIGTGEVNSANIAPLSVDNARITDNAVDLSKLDLSIVNRMLPTAWCTYDYLNGGIKDSFNINSIVQRNNVGDYTFTFLTPMSNNNYCVMIGGDMSGVSNESWVGIWRVFPQYKTTTTIRISTQADAPLGSVHDRLLHFVIFGGK